MGTMARRHWLDPLARRLLIATGQMPSPAEQAAAFRDAEVERDLQALKQARQAPLVDVNRATAQDWRQLPGCTAAQADLLVRLQAGGVQISGPEELQQLLQLDGATLAAWLPQLAFHWYGEPAPITLAPVAINRASGAELKGRLALSVQRLQRLQQERARAPFRDLADLQQRLQLPAAVVESWIGRVSFDPPEPQPRTHQPVRGEGGPTLPPTRSRASAHSRNQGRP
jgi:DNA uptake protein ComE-like DNA-binding protein